MNLGGRAYVDEDGNIVPGKQLEMVVEGDDVYIVSIIYSDCAVRALIHEST